ncbi:glycoprotein-N-acetylgalactosamine 3-beta-galactosyltransferase 1-like isoform X2 [Crassostrea virginica]
MRHTSAFLAGAVVGMVLYFVLFPNPSIFIRRHEAHTLPEELIVRKLLDTFYKDSDVELWPLKDQTDFKFEDDRNSKDNNTVGEILQRSIKVHCIVFVNEHSKLRLASAVDSTWVKRCSSLAYIGKTPNQSAPLPIVKSNYSLYATRTEATFALGDAVSYVQSKNFSESDWILFSTDNTFVIMENLRYFLSNQNSSDAVYAGKISKVAIGYARPFHSGMIVFSNTALRLLNRTSIESCNEKDVYEVTKSLCLSSNRFVDITPVDNNGTSLMNILPPKQSIKISGSTSKKVLGSPYTVSMRFLSYQNIYSYEMLVYRLRPYGIKMS